jgi:hypothetical protein
MVLLNNNNNFDIKKHHILKCLEKKKEKFDIYVVPLKNVMDKNDDNQIKNNNIDFSDIKTVDLNSIFLPNPK